MPTTVKRTTVEPADTEKSLAAPRWAKNGLFVLTTIGGCGLLFAALLSQERLPPPVTFQPASDSQQSILAVADRVDRAFQTTWDELDLPLEVAPPADDLTIARRLAYGLAGVSPSLEEIRKLESQSAELRVHWYVSRLLEDRRVSNYVAERFARGLVGVDEGPFVLYRRRRFVDWLSDQFFENRSYRDIARELLTGDGLWTDTPAVNFYTKTIAESKQPDPIVLAGRTSRAFLGMRIDCLQCHDDFLGNVNLGSADDPTSGMQVDFHSLAAFFSDTKVSLLGIKDRSKQQPYQYQLLYEEEASTIAPVVPFNRQLDVSGSETPISKTGAGKSGSSSSETDESKRPLLKRAELQQTKTANLRVRLADWVTHPENRPFARAAVNRVWAIVCGRPLVEPVDDIPLDGPFPAALEVLVDDFVEHDFDLHRLIRVISETDAFQRSSAADFEITKQHEQHWSVFPMTRLRPDQVAGAIIQATSITTIDATSPIITQLTRFGQQNEFTRRFGDAGEDEFLRRGETVTQRLLMLNGNMVNEQITNGLRSPARLTTISPDVETAVETVYLSTLTRRPTEAESERFVAQLEAVRRGQRTQKIRDLYWVLINSLEFVWNH